MSTDPIARVVILGASNVARGMATIVDAVRRVIGGPCEIMVAAGHGRSYGIRSRFVVRSINGIVVSPLWEQLEACAAEAPLPTYAFVTDIGNDVVYRVEPERTTEWVAMCLDRLAAQDARVVMTALPLDSLRRLSPVWFTIAVRLLFPRANLTFEQALADSERLDALVHDLAAARGVSMCEQDVRWYGVDPIHVRRRHWPEAYTGFLRHWLDDNDPRRDAPPCRVASRVRTLRYLSCVPAHRWMCGVEQHGKQPAITLDDGSTIALY
ncbi:MAG: hypothetical protein GC159_15360 [Phycisphaera sp.]|nr:hypothetical protein [Phycisphaera sp.]